MEPGGDSIVLEEEIDPNYEPTEKEVLEYASWLGMDLDTEQDLFWIAREGLKAPLPENWKPCKTTDTEEIYYFNFASGQSTWDHPCDEYYRKVYDDHKKKRSSSSRGGGTAVGSTHMRWWYSERFSWWTLCGT
jgi:centrosomal protein CEP164